MNTQFHPKRQFVCEVCGRPCQTKYKRDICDTCYRKESSALCVSCGNMKHLVSKDTGLCPRCADLAMRPTGQCVRCSQFGGIYNQQDWLCKACTKKERRRIRNKNKQIKVACSVCGKMRTSTLFGRAICKACHVEELNGRGICACCNKFKVIYHKGKHFCKHCIGNDRAPGTLRRYVVGFTSPYPYNTVLFNLLADTIDWNAVDENRDRQFRVFGRFLQAHKFEEPLTWGAIEEALPPRKHAQRQRHGMIRSCLLDLGHLLVARGEMESREAYTRRRNALAPIQQAPEHIRPILHRFTIWLWERRNVPENVGDYLEVLASFWSWCDQRSIHSPAEVHNALINDYLLTLYWQWQCSVCQSTVALDPYDRKAPRACDHCGTIGSYNRVKRYAHNTVLLAPVYNWLILVFGEPLKTTDLPVMLL